MPSVYCQLMTLVPRPSDSGPRETFPMLSIHELLLLKKKRLKCIYKTTITKPKLTIAYSFRISGKCQKCEQKIFHNVATQKQDPLIFENNSFFHN